MGEHPAPAWCPHLPACTHPGSRLPSGLEQRVMGKAAGPLLQRGGFGFSLFPSGLPVGSCVTAQCLGRLRHQRKICFQDSRTESPWLQRGLKPHTMHLRTGTQKSTLARGEEGSSFAIFSLLFFSRCPVVVTIGGTGFGQVLNLLKGKAFLIK